MSAKNVKELVESINSAFVSILLSEIDQSIETLYSLKLKVYNIQRILEIIKLDHSIENNIEDSSTVKETKQSDPVEKIHNIFRLHSAAYWCFEYFKNKPDGIDYESYMKDKLPSILGNTLSATRSYVSSQIYKRFKVSHI